VEAKPGALTVRSGHGHDIDAFGVRVEHDPCLATLELPHHVRNFLFELDFPLAVVRPFAQYERFDHPAQRLGGQLLVGDGDGFGRSLVHRGKIGATVGTGTDVGSLQEQLIAAGLASEKQARKVADEQRRDQRRNPGPSEAQKRAAEQAQAAQAARAARDAELNRQRQEKAERKARAAQVKQLIETHRLPKAAESDERFNFVDGKKIRFIRVDAAQRDGLHNDTLAIVRCEGRYDLVPVAAAATIRERDPRAVIPHKAAAAQDPAAAPGEDDPYKDFVIPDDLTW
jgi:uncharacterized protein YaiL (DUF2058 family)